MIIANSCRQQGVDITETWLVNLMNDLGQFLIWVFVKSKKKKFVKSPAQCQAHSRCLYIGVHSAATGHQRPGGSPAAWKHPGSITSLRLRHVPPAQTSMTTSGMGGGMARLPDFRGP